MDAQVVESELNEAARAGLLAREKSGRRIYQWATIGSAVALVAMLALYGRQTGVNLARKHIGWYTKGLPGSAEMRNRVNSQDDPAVVIAMLRDFYAPWLARSAA